MLSKYIRALKSYLPTPDFSPPPSYKKFYLGLKVGGFFIKGHIFIKIDNNSTIPISSKSDFTAPPTYLQRLNTMLTTEGICKICLGFATLGGLGGFLGRVKLLEVASTETLGE